jgi:hypothetical protein
MGPAGIRLRHILRRVPMSWKNWSRKSIPRRRSTRGREIGRWIRSWVRRIAITHRRRGWWCGQSRSWCARNCTNRSPALTCPCTPKRSRKASRSRAIPRRNCICCLQPELIRIEGGYLEKSKFEPVRGLQTERIQSSFQELAYSQSVHILEKPLESCPPSPYLMITELIQLTFHYIAVLTKGYISSMTKERKISRSKANVLRSFLRADMIQALSRRDG